jgi:hypothetical protein
MKSIFAATVVSIALALGLSAHAQDRYTPHLVKVQATSVQWNCNVNGVVYPVDYANNIWAINPATGLWFVIGHLYTTPTGFIAINYLGVQYVAVCQ